MKHWYGGIEAGGTKFVCTVGSGPDNILAEARFPTTNPDETIGQAIAFFQAQSVPLKAVGIASFGPIDPNPNSPTYGYITTTPKPYWANINLAGAIQSALGVPVAIDTDVNGAALGEYKWGAAQGLDTFLYFTIGTGIGGGGIVGGQTMHGLVHPEIGHIMLPKVDEFEGTCPFHGHCFEGLASGPALEKRWGMPAANLSPEHPAWEIEATTIALAMHNMVCTLSPQRIILGGGVMQQEHLFPMIRAKMQETLNGYVQAAAILDDIDTFIVPPALGDQAGMLGAIALAQAA